MSKLEYLLHAIKSGYLKDLTWYYTFMVILVESNYKNKYIEIVNGKLFILKDKEKILLKEHDIKEPVYLITDVFSLPKDIINNNTTIKTTIGIMVLNYILLYTTIGKNVKYINKPFKIGEIEAKIGELLNNDVVTVDNYKKFTNHCVFLEKFSRIVTISATIKNITPPDGLTAFKNKVLKDFTMKYGEDWSTDSSKVVMFEDELKSFYNAYVADDPSDGVFLSGKIKNNAGLKKYLTYGLAMGMQDPGEDIQHITGSLLDDFPTDKVKIAAMYDTARYASYNRGSETQKGGAAAKVMLRATSSIVVTTDDCKVKYGKPIRITEDIANALVSRYIIKNNKSILLKNIDEVKALIGQIVELRSPQYCLSKNTSFCRVCCGEQMAKYEKGAGLVLTDISNILLYISMAKMHNTSISGMPSNPIDNIV